MTNPDPTLATPTPALTAVAGTAQMFTLTGTGFTTTSSVRLTSPAPATTTTLAVNVLSPTQMSVMIPASVIQRVGAYSFVVVNPTTSGLGGGTSNALALTLRAAQATQAEFVNVTTAITAGNTLNAFTVRFRDEFGNLVAHNANVQVVSEDGSSTGTITLTRTATAGVSTATATRFYEAGSYRLWVEGISTTTGNTRFVVQPNVDYRVEFVGVPTNAVAGEALPTMRLRYYDRNNNLTDNGIGRLTYTKTTAPASTATVAVVRQSVGEYTFSTTALVAGAYSFGVVGIATTATVGNTRFVVQSAAATYTRFLGVDATVVLGRVQSAFTAIFSDAFGNLNDPPTLPLVEFSNATTAGISVVSSGTIILDRQSLGVYKARPVAMAAKGRYTLSVQGIPNTRGEKTFMVSEPFLRVERDRTDETGMVVTEQVMLLEDFLFQSYPVGSVSTTASVRVAYFGIASNTIAITAPEHFEMSFDNTPGSFFRNTTRLRPIASDAGSFTLYIRFAPQSAGVKMETMRLATTTPALQTSFVGRSRAFEAVFTAAPSPITFPPLDPSQSAVQEYRLTYGMATPTQMTISAPPGFMVSVPGLCDVPSTRCSFTVPRPDTYTVRVTLLPTPLPGTVQGMLLHTTTSNTLEVPVTATIKNCSPARTIRVLLLHTPEVRTVLGLDGERPATMREYIQASLKQANDFFINSNLNVRFAFVPADGVEFNPMADLGVSNDVLDGAGVGPEALRAAVTQPTHRLFALRQQYQADVVGAIYLRWAAGSNGGVAVGDAINTSDTATGPLRNNMFFTLNARVAEWGEVIAHEIGHLFSGRHEQQNDATVPAYPDGRGFRLPVTETTPTGQTILYGTVMHHTPTRVPYWSSPQGTHRYRTPTGSFINLPIGSPQHNMRRVVEKTAPVVANLLNGLGGAITGPTILGINQPATFSVDACYGTPPYTFAWTSIAQPSGTVIASGVGGQTFVQSIPSGSSGVELRVRIDDAQANQAEERIFVECLGCVGIPIAAKAASGGEQPEGGQTEGGQTEGEYTEGGQSASVAIAPNPAQDRVDCVLHLSAAAHVRLVLSDALGREVCTLHEGWMRAGQHRVAADVHTIPQGVYTISLVSSAQVMARRLVIVR